VPAPRGKVEAGPDPGCVASASCLTRRSPCPTGACLRTRILARRAARSVIYFHGAPSTRLDLTFFEDASAERGVRVVSPDRPGYGASSPQRGRRLEDWPSDVAALADHLDVERFAVLGLSSGGPYAVASAALLPDRVAGAGSVAGETDFGWPGARDGYPAHDRPRHRRFCICEGACTSSRLVPSRS
jgi:pimeloyl-ACP methyl ester carboxylesterase